MIKIAKFGGSSVADADHFRKIRSIVEADPARRFIVVSACGRRFSGDAKVTDLLYLVAAHVRYRVSCDDLLADIGQRYFDIADELGLSYPIREKFAAFAEKAKAGLFSTAELVSRGEYFTASSWPSGWACPSSMRPTWWPSITMVRSPCAAPTSSSRSAGSRAAL